MDVAFTLDAALTPTASGGDQLAPTAALDHTTDEKDC